MGSTGEMLLFVSCVVNLFTLFLFSVFFLFSSFILFFISPSWQFDIYFDFPLSNVYLFINCLFLLMSRSRRTQQPWNCLHHFVLCSHLSLPVLESSYSKWLKVNLLTIWLWRILNTCISTAPLFCIAPFFTRRVMPLTAVSVMPFLFSEEEDDPDMGVSKV